MKTFLAAALAPLIGLALMPSADAAELKVLAGGGIKPVLAELVPQFEKASGHKLDIHFDATPNLIKLATSGAPFDLGIVPHEVMSGPGVAAKFAAPVDVARAGFGVAVRAGVAKPDISTPEAFKQTMLKAKSVTYLAASAAGAQVLRTFERLGIAEAMQAKTVAQTAPAGIAQAVAKGDAELGLFLMSVLMAPGVELVGPFPGELQHDLIYVGAASADTQNAAAAQAFIDFLKTPAAAAVLKAKGMAPGLAPG
jgi:molybdate transport system substrate-binding protein